MPQGKEKGYSGGSSGKYALEGELPPVYDKLASLGVTEGIVRMTDVQVNGHTISTAWTGTWIDVEKLTGRSILQAGGTGCLEIAVNNGAKQTEIVFKEGKIIGTTKEPKGVSQRQGRMRLEIDEK